MKVLSYSYNEEYVNKHITSGFVTAKPRWPVHESSTLRGTWCGFQSTRARFGLRVVDGPQNILGASNGRVFVHYRCSTKCFDWNIGSMPWICAYTNTEYISYIPPNCLHFCLYRYRSQRTAMDSFGPLNIEFLTSFDNLVLLFKWMAVSEGLGVFPRCNITKLEVYN